MTSETSNVPIPNWRSMDREELLAVLENLTEKGGKGFHRIGFQEQWKADFDDALLAARWKVAQARELLASERERQASNAWQETLKGDRLSSRAAMKSAQARIAYERARRAAASARTRERKAWEACEAFWKAGRS